MTHGRGVERLHAPHHPVGAAVVEVIEEQGPAPGVGPGGFFVARLEQAARVATREQEGEAGGLTGPRAEAARLLLYLFERDWGVQLLRGG